MIKRHEEVIRFMANKSVPLIALLLLAVVPVGANAQQLPGHSDGKTDRPGAAAQADIEAVRRSQANLEARTRAAIQALTREVATLKARVAALEAK